MQIPNSYWWRARVLPVVLVVLPGVVLLVSFIPAVSWPGSAWFLASAAVVMLLGSLGRDAGRAMQPTLFAKWDGLPTTRRLRFRDSTNAAATARLHQLLAALPNGLNIPTQAAETADPASADQAYEVIVSALRELTRDRKRFPLVNAENVEYGFRRNLRALKRVGVAIAIVIMVVSIVGGVPLGLLVTHEAALALIVPAACAALALTLWSKVSDNWVRLPAEAYADRLMGAVEVLASSST